MTASTTSPMPSLTVSSADLAPSSPPSSPTGGPTVSGEMPSDSGMREASAPPQSMPGDRGHGPPRQPGVQEVSLDAVLTARATAAPDLPAPQTARLEQILAAASGGAQQREATEQELEALAQQAVAGVTAQDLTKGIRPAMSGVPITAGEGDTATRRGPRGPGNRGSGGPRGPRSEPRGESRPPRPVTSLVLKTGRIVRVTPEDVFVDLGDKSEGILPRAEFDNSAECVEGASIVVSVLSVDAAGTLRLSRRQAAAEEAWQNLRVGSTIEGLVTGLNKGGLDLKCHGGQIRAFMPASQCDIAPLPDISVLLNKTLQVQIRQIDMAHRELVVSRRAVLEAEALANRAQVLSELAEGQVRSGQVRSITAFGAFVDIGGVDGLLHIADISYARVRRVEDVLKVGDTIECVVLKINRSSPGREKISLGLKQKKTDPWTGIEERFTTGERLKGRVTRLAPFGAFVEIEEGLEGMIHIGEMSWTRRLNHPSELLSEGQIVEAVLLEIDKAKRNIRLGLKQAEANPWNEAQAKYPPQSMHTGKITRLAEFGAFVELEPGIEGLVHISELSDNRIRAVGDVARVGQDLAVKILSVDKAAQKVALTAKPSQMVAPPPPPTPEELAARKAAAEEAAKAKAAADAKRNKHREKLRGGLGGPGGGLGGAKIKID